MATSIILPNYMTITADELHKDILTAAPDNINTIEGDIFWDATKPMAEESAKIRNIGFKKLLYSRFPQTATEDDLTLIGEENDVTRKEADYAIQKIKFIGVEGTQISAGRLASTEATENIKSIEFMISETVVIPSSSEITVNATCTAAGTIGNVALGNIKILSKSLNGITRLENIEIVKLGVDIEDDESYRQRILEKIQKPITSGNKYEYEKWAKEVTGVGAAKCISSPGNVKVVIVDSNKHGASSELIQDVYDYIDSVRPLLAGTLTIVSAVEKAINVTSNVILAQGYNLGAAQQEFSDLVEEYLKSIPFKSTSEDAINYISIAKIGNILLNTTGVLDYSELKINNGTSNISLADEEIAVLGNVTLGI